MKRHLCNQCQGSYASPQSLWNHKQRCTGKVQATSSTIPTRGDKDPLTSKANISKTAVASAIDRIINGDNSPGSHMKYLSPLHLKKSNKVSDLSADLSVEEKVDDSEAEQTIDKPDVDSEEIDKTDSSRKVNLLGHKMAPNPSEDLKWLPKDSNPSNFFSLNFLLSEKGQSDSRDHTRKSREN